MARPKKINVYGYGTLRWRADKERWTIVKHRVDVDGKSRRVQITLPAEIQTKRDAEAEYQRRADADRLLRVGTPKTTLKDVSALCGAFLRDAAALYTVDGKPATQWSTYKSAAEMWRAAQGRITLDEYTGEDLRRFRLEVDATGRFTRGGVNKIIWAVRRVAKWGISNGFASPMLLQTLQSVDALREGQAKSAEGEGRRACTVEQYTQALEYVLQPWWRNALIILRWTGARPSEILSLRVCDVDTTGERWCVRPAKHKTKNKGFTRQIYLPKQAREALWVEMRDLSPEDYIFCPRRWLSRDKHLVLRPEDALGDVACPKVFNKVIGKACARACKEARLPKAKRWKITPYQLRHMREEEIAAKRTLEHAQANAGHSDSTMTLTYTKGTSEEKARRLGMEAASVGEDD